MICVGYDKESFMEEVYWKMISVSTPGGERRKKDLIEGEVECSAVALLFNGRSAIRMVVNCQETW